MSLSYTSSFSLFFIHFTLLYVDSFEELKTADNATQAQMIMYSKLFKINFTKMDPYEFKTLPISFRDIQIFVNL